MKFAKYLQEEVVPEWRKAYINYKQGKKYLKAIESAIENKSVSLTIDPELPSGILEGPIAQEPESEYPERPVSTYSSNNVADSPTGATPIMKQSRGSVRSYDTIQIPPYSAYSAASGATSAPGNVQSDNNSSTVLTSDHLQPRKSLRGSLDRRDSIAQQFGEAARAHSSQLFKDLTNRFTSISSPGHESRSRGIQVEGNSLDSVMDQLLDEEKQFFKFLDAQLELVDKFYRGKEVEAETKLKVLKQQLFVADEWRRRYDNKVAKAQAHKAWYQNEWSRVRNGIGSFMVDPSAIHDVTLGPASRVNTESAGSLAVGLSTGTGVNADQQLRQRENRGLVDGCGTKRPLPRQMAYQDQLVLDDEENRRQRLNHSVARTRIKTALCEFYRSLEMLKNYKVLNNTGFVKIMKKFDKTAGWKASKAFIASKLRPAYFMSSTILDDLLEETENLFIEKFENGHRRRGMAKLRIPDTKNQSHNATSARVGLYLGVAIPLVVLGIQGALSKDTQAEIPYWDSLLIVYGGLFLPILFSCLFGINMYAWAKSRINYKFIFEFDPRDNLDYHQFFELPALFMFIFSLCLYFEFTTTLTEHVAIGYYPLIVICIVFGILLCPLPIASWSARRWFLQSIGRLLVSGYHHVEFRDFFLADELNSLTYSIEQFEFAICAYTNDWNSAAQTCATSKFWLTPFITALPAWLRFLQCLRRFRDTLEWFPHLLNAGKYLSSLAQIFIYFTYRYYASTPLKVAYIIISIFTSAYTYTWDVYMDWGLFRFGKHGGGAYGHPFLRPELVYPKTWVYYLAIVLDFFGRFVWILRLVPMGLNVFVLSFCLALVEILRRWMWNFFRLENEHLNNCGQFRAIKDIPLPFHIRVEDESDESDEDGDGDGVAGERQGDAVKPGASKSSQGDQMEVVSEGSKPGLSEPAAATTASLHKQSLVRTTSASGSMANRLGSGGPASASQISIRSISSSRASNRPSLKNRPSQSSMAPYGLQRSNTFVDNAMTEAGIGEDRKEQVAAANKFYDRRDFDTKIIDCATEGLFRIRRRSTTTVPHTIGLGTDVQGASTDPDGLMESTSRSRRTIKNSIFGRKSHTDEDDTDEDDEV